MLKRLTEVPAPLGRGATRGWLLVTAVTVALILMETLQGMVFTTPSPRPVPVFYMFGQNVIWWGAWLLLVPAVVWFAAVVRLDDSERAFRRAPVHLLAATITASAHISFAALLIYYTVPPRPPTGPETLTGLIFRWHAAYLMFNYMVYGFIIGGYYAIDYVERFRQSAILTSRLAAQASRLEHRATEARLQALRMELNPHFFFNSLNSISALVRNGRAEAAIATIARLGDLLRATLDRTSAGVTSLGEELHLLSLYLEIERARFGERLDVRITVPSELTTALVPALALQPLVENSIRHGIAKLTGRAVLGVTAQRRNGKLVLEVRDNGEGFPEEAKIREGVGLSNTRARLEQLYGPNASLQLSKAPGGGAVVTMTLPFEEAKKEEPLVASE